MENPMVGTLVYTYGHSSLGALVYTIDTPMLGVLVNTHGHSILWALVYTMDTVMLGGPGLHHGHSNGGVPGLHPWTLQWWGSWFIPMDTPLLGVLVYTKDIPMAGPLIYTHRHFNDGAGWKQRSLDHCRLTHSSPCDLSAAPPEASSLQGSSPVSFHSLSFIFDFGLFPPKFFLGCYSLSDW